MLTEQTLYKNVEDGLLSAPPHLQRVFKDRFLRILLEALILDGNRAPAQLYQDLFAISYEELDTYEHYFFNRGDETSRIHFYRYLISLEEGEEKRLKQRVFDEGWEFIDLVFNRGVNVSVESVAKEAYVRASLFALRKIRTQLSSLQDLKTGKDTVKQEMATSALKELLAIVKDGVKLFPNKDENEGVDQLMFEFEQAVKRNSTQIEGMHSKLIGADLNEVGQVDVDEKVEKELQGILDDVSDLKEIVRTKGNRLPSSEKS